MQIVLILLGAVLGLIYGKFTDGFIFSSNICLFAGLTLIMPTLFNVKIQDIKLIFHYRTIILKSLVVNFILLPLIALMIGLLTHNYGVAAGIFLLSVLSGGGMVMNWIKKSGADTSIGFILLFINLIFISLSLLMLHTFGIYTAEYFGESYTDERNLENFARAVITLLIIIPFVASRVVIYIEPLKNFINEKRIYISNISLFIILFYLFGLQKSQLIFELYDFEPELIPISIIAVIVFYFSSFFLAKLIYDLESTQERAAFWYSVTRYITLALVLSTFSINTFGISIILPIMFAYIVQVPFAIIIERKIVAADSKE